MDIEIYNAEKDNFHYPHEFNISLPPRITMSYAIEILYTKKHLTSDVYQNILIVLADYLANHKIHKRTKCLSPHNSNVETKIFCISTGRRKYASLSNSLLEFKLTT